VPEFIDSVRHYRASLIASASNLEAGSPADLSLTTDEQDAVVVPLHRKER
jgi:flagellar protein FlbD